MMHLLSGANLNIVANPGAWRFLGVVGALAGCLWLHQTAIGQEKAAESRAKPNVVLIIADDLGYGQLSCYPQTEVIRTPSIDRLARTGIRMTDGYSAHPMCLQSRSSILTGRYYQRLGNLRRIPRRERMIPQYLEKAGYVSACIGKWHNCTPGTDLENGPLTWGFDEFFGFLGGMRDYFDPEKGFQTGQGWIYMPVYAGTTPVAKMKYLTEELTDRAVTFITRHKDRPFFVYLPYTAIHSPIQAPKQYLERAKGNGVVAMIDALDDGVGRVLDTLDRLKLAEDTMVFFVGDNGGAVGSKHKNWKLRSQKGQNFEGGIRVPFLVSWPKGLPAGHVYSQPVMHIDLLPTILAAAGLEVPDNRNVDGTNLLPYWRGERTDAPHDALFWGQGNKRYAVRRGQWKLVNDSDKWEGELERGLYNLKDDPSEKHNLLEQEPPIAGQLQAWKKGIRDSGKGKG